MEVARVIAKTKNHGQALVECMAFTFAMALLLSVTVSFTKWFLIRERLLLAVREGAILYSSGHFRPSQVQDRLTHFLTMGIPALEASALRFSIGPAQGLQAQAFGLDEIK